MHCPVCPDATLEARYSHGIEVDVCSSCGGVWLDRGELDKLLAQSRTEPKLGAYEPPAVPTTSTEERLPTEHARREVDAGDDDGDDRQEWRSDRRSGQRRAEDRRDDRSRKSKRQSLGDLLEEILDEVLDLDDFFEDILD